MSDVLVVAEHRQDAIRPVTFELIGAAGELAPAVGGRVHVAVINGQAEAIADELDVEGVDHIHPVAYDDTFNHDVYVQALVQLVDQLSVSYVLAAHSANGLDFAPALASMVEWPLVTDVTAIDDVDDQLSVVRDMYNSKVETTVAIDADTAVLTLREGEWPVAESTGSPTIETTDITIDADAIGSTVTGYEEMAAGDIDIADADVLIGIGRGIEEEENLEIIEALAEALDAPIGASRPIVDAGWLPKNRQVGQSGKTITPEVYLAIGISGAVQHIAGIKGAETIIAVNKDPNAPIFDIADYGIVDDLFDVVPALTETLSN